MSALALFLKSRGFIVEGSDAAPGEYTAKLEREGIPVFIGHDGSRIGRADAVIASSAISETDEELAAARGLGRPVYGRADLLSYAASQFENTVGIAGCHGKTTAAAMCAHVMQECSGSCTAHIGGADLDYGNFFAGGNKYFVTEACE